MNYNIRRTIMIKIKSYTAFLFILLTMSSCQFSEDCNYAGNVQLIMDWESMWGNLLKPDSLTALFYRNGNLNTKNTLLGDTIYENIPSGETEMIIYNQAEGTTSTGLDIYTNGELHLPTYFEGNIRAVNDCPMICGFNSCLNVPIESTVKQLVTPLPIVKQMIFIVHIIREGVTGNITSCEASLSGIATGYSLSRQEAIRSKATVFFPLERDTKEEEEDYKHSLFVLGVNPAKDGEESISKKLSVTVALDDGEVKSEDVDITAELENFTANVFKCEVNVKITSLSTTVEIASWKQGVWNQIIIQ